MEGTATYKGRTLPVKMFQEISFQTFTSTNNKGLKIKIDLSKNITDNIPTKEVQESKTLLTEEVHKFLDEP